MSASEDLLLVGDRDSGLSGDETGCRTEEFLSDDPRSAAQSPSQGRRSPADVGGLLAKLRRKLDVGVAPSQGDYKLYPWRWFMLATLCLLNLSNGMMWLTFAPIPNYTAVFYGVTLDQVDWFSISYFVVSLLIGFVAIAILDIFGLRVALYLGAGFNVVGAVLRWVSCSPSIICSPHYALSGYLVAMTGQIFTACAQPFLLYAPTKLASFWFGPKERAFCTMLSSLGNPVGLGLAQLISPHVVSSLDNFSTLHLIYTLPAAVGAACCGIAYWWSKPSIPPAPSAHRDPTPFLTGLKQTLTTPSFLLLLGIWGCSSGLFNAMLTLLAQILCPYGYSNRSSGLWGALMIFCGLLGATCGGLIIDHFKLFKEVAVVSFSLALLCLIWFVEVFSLSGQGVTIAFSLCAFGFFALPLIPAIMELGVEVTYPVSEATSSGLLWSMTQVVGIVLVLVGQAIQQDVVTANSKCGVNPVSNATSLHCRVYNSSRPWEEIDPVSPMDFTYPLLLYLVVGAVALIAMAVLFRPKYKRLEMESRAALLAKLQEEDVTPSSSIASLPAAKNPSKNTQAHSNLGHTSTQL